MHISLSTENKYITCLVGKSLVKYNNKWYNKASMHHLVPPKLERPTGIQTKQNMNKALHWFLVEIEMRTRQKNNNKRYKKTI